MTLSQAIRMEVGCPALSSMGDLLTELPAVITTLNDECRWTREQIADWVETLEKQQDAPAAAEQIASVA